MNIYDTANKLAAELKQTDEYKAYKNSKQQIESNAEVKSKIVQAVEAVTGLATHKIQVFEMQE